MALSGLVVLVPRRVDGDVTSQLAVVHKLESLGARPVPRFSKDVTHIVYLKKLLPSHEESCLQEAQLRELYSRIGKERDYIIEKPGEPRDARFYAASPRSCKGAKKGTGRRKSLKAVPVPTDVPAFDIDDSMFSSSQQIKELTWGAGNGRSYSSKRVGTALALQPSKRRIICSAASRGPGPSNVLGLSRAAVRSLMTQAKATPRVPGGSVALSSASTTPAHSPQMPRGSQTTPRRRALPKGEAGQPQLRAQPDSSLVAWGSPGFALHDPCSEAAWAAESAQGAMTDAANHLLNATPLHCEGQTPIRCTPSRSCKAKRTAPGTATPGVKPAGSVRPYSDRLADNPGGSGIAAHDNTTAKGRKSRKSVAWASVLTPGTSPTVLLLAPPPPVVGCGTPTLTLTRNTTLQGSTATLAATPASATTPGRNSGRSGSRPRPAPQVLVTPDSSPAPSLGAALADAAWDPPVCQKDPTFPAAIMPQATLQSNCIQAAGKSTSAQTSQPAAGLSPQGQQAVGGAGTPLICQLPGRSGAAEQDQGLQGQRASCPDVTLVPSTDKPARRRTTTPRNSTGTSKDAAWQLLARRKCGTSTTPIPAMLPAVAHLPVVISPVPTLCSAQASPTATAALACHLPITQPAQPGCDQSMGGAPDLPCLAGSSVDHQRLQAACLAPPPQCSKILQLFQGLSAALTSPGTSGEAGTFEVGTGRRAGSAWGGLGAGGAWSSTPNAHPTAAAVQTPRRSTRKRAASSPTAVLPCSPLSWLPEPIHPVQLPHASGLVATAPLQGSLPREVAAGQVAMQGQDAVKAWAADEKTAPAKLSHVVADFSGSAMQAASVRQPAAPCRQRARGKGHTASEAHQPHLTACEPEAGSCPDLASAAQLSAVAGQAKLQPAALPRVLGHVKIPDLLPALPKAPVRPLTSAMQQESNAPGAPTTCASQQDTDKVRQQGQISEQPSSQPGPQVEGQATPRRSSRRRHGHAAEAATEPAPVPAASAIAISPIATSISACSQAQLPGPPAGCPSALNPTGCSHPAGSSQLARPIDSPNGAEPLKCNSPPELAPHGLAADPAALWCFWPRGSGTDAGLLATPGREADGPQATPPRPATTPAHTPGYFTRSQQKLRSQSMRALLPELPAALQLGSQCHAAEAQAGCGVAGLGPAPMLLQHSSKPAQLTPSLTDPAAPVQPGRAAVAAAALDTHPSQAPGSADEQLEGNIASAETGLPTGQPALPSSSRGRPVASRYRTAGGCSPAAPARRAHMPAGAGQHSRMRAHSTASRDGSLGVQQPDGVQGTCKAGEAALQAAVAPQSTQGEQPVPLTRAGRAKPVVSGHKSVGAVAGKGDLPACSTAAEPSEALVDSRPAPALKPRGPACPPQCSAAEWLIRNRHQPKRTDVIAPVIRSRPAVPLASDRHDNPSQPALRADPPNTQVIDLTLSQPAVPMCSLDPQGLLNDQDAAAGSAMAPMELASTEAWQTRGVTRSGKAGCNSKASKGLGQRAPDAEQAAAPGAVIAVATPMAVASVVGVTRPLECAPLRNGLCRMKQSTLTPCMRQLASRTGSGPATLQPLGSACDDHDGPLHPLAQHQQQAEQAGPTATAQPKAQAKPARRKPGSRAAQQGSCKYIAYTLWPLLVTHIITTLITWPNPMHGISKYHQQCANPYFIPQTPDRQLHMAAVAQLGGAKLCTEGSESQITHLVVGVERRTLKMLLAIAAGAFLVSPQWVQDSCKAGQWLPEAQYTAAPRFSAAAAAACARAAAVPASPGPLAGYSVCIHCPQGTAPTASASSKAWLQSLGAAASKTAALKAGLQRLVVALGGKVAAAAACSLVVLVEGSTAPKGLAPGARVVQEEWLLLVAETHQLPTA
ncbi:hypothetical protein QJQ45_006192 [Haematococcus lacustris]|nr:hypothetical protein QJQ45_006192 [Haematococcus lacustris]